jgi:hypothetical protein
MAEVILLLTPLGVLALVAVSGFVGCTNRYDPLVVDDDEPNGPPAPDLYVKAVTDSTPIAYWRLTDPFRSTEAKDEIGAPTPPSGNNPGVVVGTVAFGQAPPGLNLSDPNVPWAHFDGTGFVEVAHADVFEMVEFTVEALVAPDSVVSDCQIVSNMSSSGGWALSIVPPSPGDDPNIGYFAPVVSDGTGPVGPPAVAFDLAKLGTAWHVAVTFNGTLFTLYWDGVERVSSPWPAVGEWPFVPNMQEPLQIGADFKGAIQEVAVYNTVLPADEINDHFVANTSPDP